MVPLTVMILGFLIMTAFVPGIVGAVSPTAWVVMLCGGSVLLLKTEIKLTLIHWLGLLFLSYAAISCLWSPHGALDFLHLLALTSVFVWAATLKDLKTIVIGLALGLSVSAAIATLQYFHLVNFIFQATAKPSGLFVNSNVFSEITGMMLILLIVSKLWWFLPSVVPGLLVSSRSVALGLGLTGLLWVWSRSKSLAITIILLFGSLGLWLTDFTNFQSIDERFDIWRDTISGFTLLGHGIGSFQYEFPFYAKHLDISLNHPFEAHNDILQLIFELGIGVIPLMLIMVILLKVNDAYKYSLFFFIVIGLFGFPFYMPVTAFMAALVAGYLVKYSLDGSHIINYFRPNLSRGIQTQ